MSAVYVCERYSSSIYDLYSIHISTCCSGILYALTNQQLLTPLACNFSIIFMVAKSELIFTSKDRNTPILCKQIGIRIHLHYILTNKYFFWSKTLYMYSSTPAQCWEHLCTGNVRCCTLRSNSLLGSCLLFSCRRHSPSSSARSQAAISRGSLALNTGVKQVLRAHL